jgi:hypothetical protein
MVRIRNVYKTLVQEPEGMRPLGRPTHKWDDNIRKYLKDIGYDNMDWFHLAQKYPVAGSCKTVLDLGIPKGEKKSGKFLYYLSGYQLLKKDSAAWS